MTAIGTTAQSRRGFLHTAGLGALSLALSRSAAAGQPQTTRPNIILCMADDQGWGETGYNGHPYLKTPVLDEMAANGLRFDRFYAAAPVCSPTRASCMTGRHPNRMGTFAPNWAIRPEEITIAHLLKQAGYRTGHFGKWHLGAVKAASPVNPRACGFDEYLSHDNFFELDPPLSRNGADPEIIKGESSEIVAAAAVEFIRKVKAERKPFLAAVWFGSPHGPYRGLEKDVALYGDGPDEDARHRYAEITAMDRAIGQLRSALREMNLAENTLFWYCSDNGIPGAQYPNGGLKGTKGTIYDGGLRVPGIIEWPEVIRTPRTASLAAVTSDILPTVLDLLGLPLPDRPIDGVSLKPLLLGGVMTERPHPIGFWKYPTAGEKKNDPWMDPERIRGTTPTTKQANIQFTNFKHPVPRTNNFGGQAAWRDNRYKIVESGKTMELYDMIADPLEKNDLAEAKPELVAKMTAELRDWQRSVERSLSGADYRK